MTNKKERFIPNPIMATIETIADILENNNNAEAAINKAIAQLNKDIILVPVKFHAEIKKLAADRDTTIANAQERAAKLIRSLAKDDFNNWENINDKLVDEKDAIYARLNAALDIADKELEKSKSLKQKAADNLAEVAKIEETIKKLKAQQKDLKAQSKANLKASKVKAKEAKEATKTANKTAKVEVTQAANKASKEQGQRYQEFSHAKAVALGNLNISIAEANANFQDKSRDVKVSQVQAESITYSEANRKIDAANADKQMLLANAFATATLESGKLTGVVVAGTVVGTAYLAKEATVATYKLGVNASVTTLNYGVIKPVGMTTHLAKVFLTEAAKGYSNTNGIEVPEHAQFKKKNNGPKA